MAAPFEFTDEEHEALARVNKLAVALNKVEADIKTLSHRILREKARRDQLLARKESIEVRLKRTIDLIDTAKYRAP